MEQCLAGICNYWVRANRLVFRGRIPLPPPAPERSRSLPPSLAARAKHVSTCALLLCASPEGLLQSQPRHASIMAVYNLIRCFFLYFKAQPQFDIRFGVTSWLYSLSYRAAYYNFLYTLIMWLVLCVWSQCHAGRPNHVVFNSLTETLFITLITIQLLCTLCEIAAPKHVSSPMRHG